jgi:hypothetical protein
LTGVEDVCLATSVAVRRRRHGGALGCFVPIPQPPTEICRGTAIGHRACSRPAQRLGASHLHPPWISPSRPTAQGRASRRRPTRGGPPGVDNDARRTAAAGTGKKRPGSGAGRRPGAGRRGARPARPGARRPSAFAGLPAPRPARGGPPPGRGRGQAIDPWRLAAARHALDLHQWLVAPDFDQEGAVRQAEQVLAEAAAPPRCSPPPPGCTRGSAATATEAAVVAPSVGRRKPIFSCEP